MKRHLLGIIALASALAGCAKNTTSEGGANGAPARIPVQTTLVSEELLPVRLEITGTVQAIDRAFVASRFMGAIEELPVTLGQRVKAGDVLVKIAAGEVSAQVSQALTQLQAARRDLERERGLQATGASTIETVRNLEDRVATSEAQLRQAEVMLGYAILRSPFDGVIAQKLANQGNLATPGAPLLEVHGAGRFEVEAAVPESLAAGLQIGGTIAVSIPASGTSFAGAVTEIASAVDVQARAVTVKISVPEGNAVHSGQFARIQLPGPARRALLVPASAVTKVGQMERVFSVSTSSGAVLRLVRTGPQIGDRVEILAGIDPGDRVVVSPPSSLREGESLEVRP
jgi:RND family efflux transporter MFP subunit